MNTEDNRHIDELIGNVLEDNVPADVDRRLRCSTGGLSAPTRRNGQARRTPFNDAGPPRLAWRVGSGGCDNCRGSRDRVEPYGRA